MAKKKQVQSAKEQRLKIQVINPPESIQAQVDMFCHAKAQIEINEKILESAAKELRDHALDIAVKTRSMEQIAFSGSANDNIVSIQQKDSFHCKDAKPISKLLLDREINPKQFVKVTEKIEINFKKMTREERQALVDALGKILDPIRFLQLVEKTTDVEISGLKDQLAQIAEDREEMDELRKASGHAEATLMVK